jgi:hypothetical protein
MHGPFDGTTCGTLARAHSSAAGGAGSGHWRKFRSFSAIAPASRRNVTRISLRALSRPLRARPISPPSPHSDRGLIPQLARIMGRPRDDSNVRPTV